ncbi:MAG: ABC transporter ATP-binding protein [Bacilli bacterium]|nr:ABC transporter ATP-binding protein [Bacilli bacterium]
MFKKFISYYKNYLGLFIFDLTCVLIMGGIDLIFPSALKNILNTIIPAGDMQTLAVYGAVLFGLYALRFGLAYCVGYYGHTLGINIESSMRLDLFKKFETLDYSYFDTKKTGELLANLTSHLNDVSEMAHHVPEDLFISIIMAVGSFIILMNSCWQLTLIVFAFVIILLIYAIWRRKKMMARFRSVQNERSEMTSKMSNSLEGIYLTKAYSNEEFEIEKFKDTNESYRQSRRKSFKEIGLFSSGVTFFTNMANLSMLVIGGFFVYKQIIDYVDLITFFLYINFLIQALNKIGNSVVETFQQGWSGYEKFYQVMQTKSKIQESEHPITQHDFKGDVEFKNVTFEYHSNESHVLNNFSLQVKAGQNVALVGETGVGKSTISKLIPRFYDVEKGEVLIDGINVKDYDLYTLRSSLGHVQQDVFIFWGTIKDNILYGKPNASEEEVVEAAKRAHIHDFITSLPDGYETLVGERGIRLSGGQKQRIAIARLFLRKPKIVILDEATSALDNVTERQIQHDFDELAKHQTTIVIAHRLTTVRNADKIVVMGKDGIIEEGNHSELMAKNGAYAKMYNASLEK